MFEEIVGRLREIKNITRQMVDGKGYTTTKLFIAEVPYVKYININLGKLSIINTIRNNIYLLTEVIDVVPSHRLYMEINDIKDRKEREEKLKVIENSFYQSNSDDVWLDVYLVPTNYLLIIENNSFKVKKGYEAPILGSVVRFLNDEAYVNLIGSKNGVPIGKVLNSRYYIPIDIIKAIRYHIGIFGFTGTGKSNLISILTRKILNYTNSIKIVIFDVSLEYSILLLDLLVNQNSLVLTTDKIPRSSNEFGKRFVRTHVIPNELLSKKDTIKSLAEKLYSNNKIKRIEVPVLEEKYMTYNSLIKFIKEQLEEKYLSTSYKPLLYLFLKKLEEFMIKKNLSGEDIVDDSIAELLNEMESIARELRIRENTSFLTFISTLKAYSSLAISTIEDENLLDIENLAIQILEDDLESPRIVIIETTSVDDARIISYNLLNEIFRRRKKSYSTDQLLFIFDEAQEFIPYDTRGKEGSELSSIAIENLLRHGRKYYMNGVIATQRL
ncbi:MAG: DUF87 domain-containing protein, partial [Sulfolobaceae archaeon]